MNDVSPAARRTPLAKKLLLACGATILALFAAEAGYRVVLHVQGHAYSADAARREMQNVLSSMLTRATTGSAPATEPEQGADIPDVHPYIAFEAPTGLADMARDVAYFDSPNAVANYDIVVLGGSVAAMFYDDGSHRLVELVQADPRFAKRRVRCFQYARPAFKQPQQVNVLTFLLCLGMRPDCVIELDGFNELAVAHGNAEIGTHPLYPSAWQWGPLVRGSHLDREVLDLMLDVRDHERGAQAIAETWSDWGLFTSAIAGRFGLSRAHRLRGESVALQDRVVEGLKAADERHVLRGPDFNSANVMKQCVRGWTEGSLSLDALCRERGILFIHALQPTLHDTGSKPLTEQELRTGKSPASWADGVLRGYPRLREKGAELALHGVRFIDCSMVFRNCTADLYFDGCHFNAAGHVLLAEAIAPFLLKCLDTAPGSASIAGAEASGTESEPRSR